MARMIQAGQNQRRKTTGEDRIPAIWRGEVTEVNEAGVWIIVPQHSGDERHGPVDQLEGLIFAPGDRVIVAMVQGRRDDPVIIGRVATSHTDPV